MRVLWILGAGASKEAGYPLVKDFFDVDYLCYLRDRIEIRGVETSSLQPLHRELEFFLDEGSDLNALMSAYLDQRDTSKVERLNSYIYGVFDAVVSAHEEFGVVPYFATFAQYLAGSNSAVLSFNYDSMVEEQLGRAHWFAEQHYPAKFDTATPPYDLGLGNIPVINAVSSGCDLLHTGSGMVLAQLPKSGRVRVLKLHGSLGLFYCGVCHHLLYDPPSKNLSRYFTGLRSGPPRAECMRCCSTRQFHSLLVPPASDQSFPAWRILDELWGQAASELSSADVVVIAGYSLPEEDVRARALLSRYLGENLLVKKIVVDPGLNRQSADAYSAVLGHFISYPKPFGQFTRDLNSFRTRALRPTENNITPECWDLLRLITSSKFQRSIKSSPYCLSLGRYADDVLFDDAESTWARSAAAEIVGCTSVASAVDILSKTSQDCDDLQLAFSCVMSLGGHSSQNALDCAALYLFDHRVVKSLTFPWRLGKPFVTISEAAQLALTVTILTNPTLDYRRAVIPLAHLSAEGLRYERLTFATEVLKLADRRGILKVPYDWYRDLLTGSFAKAFVGATIKLDYSVRWRALCARVVAARAAELRGLESVSGERPSEAIVHFLDALSLYQEVSKDAPASITPYVANSMSQLAHCYAALDDVGRAVRLAEAALEYLRPLAKRYPLSYQNELDVIADDLKTHKSGATHLVALGKRLRAAGDPHRALAPTLEGACLLLARAQERTSRPFGELALALNRVSINLGMLHRFREAIPFSHASIALYLKDLGSNPCYVQQIVEGLNNLRIHLKSMGKSELARDLEEKRNAVYEYASGCRERGTNPTRGDCLELLGDHLEYLTHIAEKDRSTAVKKVTELLDEVRKTVR